MNGPLILIAGSASPTAQSEKLERAHAFVRLLTRQIVAAGGGLVVFAGGEPVAANGTPLIFDWTSLRELETLPSSAQLKSVVVTSQKARTAKITDQHRALLARLSARGLIDIVSIPDDVHTGGNIGDEQTTRASAMIAISGGKGVADRARKLQRFGRPVLPLDIALGSLSNDGDGAVALHHRFLEVPSSFFPSMGDSLRSRILGWSLDAPAVPLEDIAEEAVLAVLEELNANVLQGPLDALVLTALPMELAAARKVFELGQTQAATTASGTQYWSSRLAEAGDSRVVGIACFAGAGNVDAAVITTDLVSRLKPRAVIMIGIAAGLRGKCRLGEIILSERVLAYEAAALLKTDDGPRAQPRPEQYRTVHSVRQQIAGYLSELENLRTRLVTGYAQWSLTLPNEHTGDVATDVVPRLATLASGEKLFRDPDALEALRALHGRVEVAEMEAVGVASACEAAGVPYLIIRGISDFGDAAKDDRFHEPAALGAAIVARDFLLHAHPGSPSRG